MITIWGRANSNNVMKVIWLLEEMGLPYVRIDAGGAFGRTDSLEYRRMNPTKLVPTLQDGEFNLFESNAILRYLCNAYSQGADLYPLQAQPRGRIDAWLDFQQAMLAPPMAKLFLGMVRTSPDKRDYALIRNANAQASLRWGILEKELDGRDYIGGSEFSIADIAHGPLLHRWFSLPTDKSEPFSALQALYGRYLDRPAYRRLVAVSLT